MDEYTTLEMSCSPERTTAAAVSSHELSIPRMYVSPTSPLYGAELLLRNFGKATTDGFGRSIQSQLSHERACHQHRKGASPARFPGLLRRRLRSRHPAGNSASRLRRRHG